ncbi:MAG: cupin domain-containing protein [Muribaculaceae bacterium]|nr:cupin domain-containing protein [Muribaculaceae bacterium]
MQIILLSGGSGTRLWPLSNDARSKQFLRLLDVEGSDHRESMVQRVMRQLRSAGLSADITVATSASQRDSVIAQLGSNVSIVTEPSRRDTFPAICLACEYLAKEKGCPADETVVVMPCDPYTETGYFETIMKMAAGLEGGACELMVMGINPTYPSAKYGYIVPATSAENAGGVIPVARFTEKPDVKEAERLISEGALWNGGVFAFRLSYVTDFARRYVDAPSFAQTRERYDEFPKISFDYEVAEKAHAIGMVRYNGNWKDLGTWNTLTDELRTHEYGNVHTDGTGVNTHIFNELGIPLLCLGTRDLVIAASPDGIIVSEKAKSENVKAFAATLKQRPMFEERRWGTYKVIDTVEFPDGYCALTKQLTLNPDCSISYQLHHCREEVWTFIDGDGEIVIDGQRRPVRRGETVVIPKGARHALRAITTLTLIEVQTGSNLVEEDIERFEYNWQD